MCISPVIIKNQTITFDRRKTSVVPCGKCPECLTQRLNAWAFRLKKQMEISENCRMVTFTYSDENQPKSFNGLPTLRKLDFQDFMKRYRKSTGRQLKYFMSGEYGDETERPHYHALMFNIQKLHVLDSKYIEKTWGKGHVHLAPMNIATIKYTLKYISKSIWEPQHEEDDRNKPFSLMSKNLGANFMTPQMVEYLKNHPNGTLTIEQGQKIAIPRYYKDRAYSTGEKWAMATEAVKESELRDQKKFKNENHRNQWKINKIRQHNKKLNLYQEGLKSNSTKPTKAQPEK